MPTKIVLVILATAFVAYVILVTLAYMLGFLSDLTLFVCMFMPMLVLGIIANMKDKNEGGESDA